MFWRVQPRIAVCDSQINGGIGGNITGGGNDGLKPGFQLIQNSHGVIFGDIAYFKMNAGFIRHDIHLNATRHDASMKRGIRNIEIMILCAMFGNIGLQCPDSTNQITGQMQGVNRGRSQSRMCFASATFGGNGGFAFMANGQFHFCWLTNNTHGWPDIRCRHHMQQRWHAQTAQFLVIG